MYEKFTAGHPPLLFHEWKISKLFQFLHEQASLNGVSVLHCIIQILDQTWREVDFIWIPAHDLQTLMIRLVRSTDLSLSNYALWVWYLHRYIDPRWDVSNLTDLISSGFDLMLCYDPKMIRSDDNFIPGLELEHIVYKSIAKD